MTPQIKSVTLILPSNAGNKVFHQAKLRFEQYDISDVFTKRNSKSLDETVYDYRYQHLGDMVYRHYKNSLDEPLGIFLGKLKSRGDMFYKDFLNAYGDSTFCRFKLIDPLNAGKKGLYVFVVNQEVRYIGSCSNQFQKRITLGHGKILPKNCYLEGMATDCHLNARIAQEHAEIKFYLLPLESDDEIIQLEHQLIADYAPTWNFPPQAGLEAQLQLA